ncbi:glycosyl transferase group 1 [Lentinula aciculospora]|uniref:Glycosyl transferase group 1 n=1 Tax=Lentinula aciculospora TaxID=153920 RepID=A0A9W9A0J2_9AGAR|nr:glycosyl transferase group 1 [Lentinula aciculospora]
MAQGFCTPIGPDPSGHSKLCSNSSDQPSSRRVPPLKIGITCVSSHGGSGVVATELGLELATRGHQIHFITSSPPFRLVGRDADMTNIHFHEVESIHYPLFEHCQPYDLALATRMAEAVEKEGLDILHVHYAIPHSISAYLAKQMIQARRPTVSLPIIITTLHGTDTTLVGIDKSYMPITRFAIEQSDGVTTVSSSLRQSAYENFDIWNTDIEVIHNFVNCDIYSPRLKRSEKEFSQLRSLYADPSEKLVVNVSNFRRIKRVSDVIEVFARVISVLPARLMLIGDGPDRQMSEHLAKELGVFDKVQFIGKQGNITKLLPLADLIILPSEMESFGLSALEAMACSVPAIVTRVGGFPELVKDKINGVICDVGDIEGMTEATVDILGDPENLESLSSNMKTITTRHLAQR